MSAAFTRDFPVTYLYEMDPTPESAPILEFHAHDALELGYCHSGSGILVVEDRVIPFSAGDICVVKEGEMHMSRGESGQPSHWSYFWIDPGRLLAEMPDALEMVRPMMFSGPNFPYIFSAVKYEKLCLTLRDIVEELKERPKGHRVLVKGLACAFLARLYRACESIPQEDEDPVFARQGVERIAPALYHMTNHYTDPIEIEPLAKLCNMSIRNFRRIFQEATGKSPMQYLVQLRVRMGAAILSESEKSISQVAFEVGFESINTFNRQFRAAFGTSPTQWRQQHGRPLLKRRTRSAW